MSSTPFPRAQDAQERRLLRSRLQAEMEAQLRDAHAALARAMERSASHRSNQPRISGDRVRHAQALSGCHEELMATVNNDAKGLSPATLRHVGSSWDEIQSAIDEARRRRHIRELFDAAMATPLPDVHVSLERAIEREAWQRANQLRISGDRGRHAQVLLRCHEELVIAASSNAERLSSASSTLIQPVGSRRAEPRAGTANGGMEEKMKEEEQEGRDEQHRLLSATSIPSQQEVDSGAAPGAGTANAGVGGRETLNEQEDENEMRLSSSTSVATQQAVGSGAKPGAATANGGAEDGTEGGGGRAGARRGRAKFQQPLR